VYRESPCSVVPEPCAPAAPPALTRDEREALLRAGHAHYLALSDGERARRRAELRRQRDEEERLEAERVAAELDAAAELDGDEALDGAWDPDLEEVLCG
jgi:hypothetical protein